MPERWLFDLLMADHVARCARCGGTGRSPVEASRLCAECWGYGYEGWNIARRFDKGCVERYCVHGVGHTVSTLAMKYPDWSHGCCSWGCCQDYERKGE